MTGGPQTVSFGVAVTAVGPAGMSDSEMYGDMFGDVAFAIEQGFEKLWMIEHHFSDYFPTANPLQLLAYIAGRYGDAIDLGTCVIIPPWYQPLRLAEDIAQLRLLTKRPIGIGIGRGTAILEYERFGIPNMDESRDRFRETYEIVHKALTEDTITYEGRYLSVPKPTRLRPKVDPAGITFYGAVGSTPTSAEIMADMGLPIMCSSFGDFDKQAEIVRLWKARAAQNGMDPAAHLTPIMVNCIVADTDAEAVAEAQEFIPKFMQAQLDHYEGEGEHLRILETYSAWRGIFEGMKKRCDPANIPPWTKGQLIGSPETVIAQTKRFVEAGYNHIFLQTATPGVPPEPRRRWQKRFMEEVVPHLELAPEPA
ncbi:LLM class flavin-dependent oxidoreductase [Acuticoccus mangrovi]|uniref:LLM class flavin-dependent oxidoreductase n=1 Tax=Acuticoccus mangrovi TaxID=2796142 RepID=A0A934MID0_9HYPH|nr:LLM class flavin-dependent oxidoreductase [Acuticoccus mangrovi]MBJ3778633.1 LLM class flavin-dependent oxidoreductase [Acuticoccus mangrovi]